MTINKTDIIAVTGGTGFLGSHLTKKLNERGYKYVVSLGSKDFDLTLEQDVRFFYRDVRPNIVFHLAAVVGGIGANQLYPGRFFRDNMLMGLNLIHGAAFTGEVKKFVQVGTVCSYPKHCETPFSETHLWEGYPEETNAPYGIAKKSLLVMLQAYRQQYGLNGIFLMPTNMYGPNDHFDLQNSHVIPAIIRKIDDATKKGDDVVTLWGSGNATREFLYVEDCADALIVAMEQYNSREPVNLASANRDISIRELAYHIKRLMGYEGQLRFDLSKPDGQPVRLLDDFRARKYFNWEAQTSLEEGLQKTISWYKQCHQ